MEIDEFRGKPNSMPLTTSKNWSKIPRSESTVRQRSAMSGVTMGKGASGLTKESSVVGALAEGAHMSSIGAGRVVASVAAVESEADSGTSDQAPNSTAVSGDEELLPVGLCTGFAGAGPVTTATAREAELNLFGGGFLGRRLCFRTPLAPLKPGFAAGTSLGTVLLAAMRTFGPGTSRRTHREEFLRVLCGFEASVQLCFFGSGFLGEYPELVEVVLRRFTFGGEGMATMEDVVLQASLPPTVQNLAPEVVFVIVVFPLRCDLRKELMEETQVAATAALPGFDVQAIFAGDGVD
jgi:hypothetical protein